jgi:hypothetical protein
VVALLALAAIAVGYVTGVVGLYVEWLFELVP